MAPFFMDGFNCLKATATSRRQFTFYHIFPRNSWYSFYWPWKDERLSQPWSHPVVLNTGPLDWESSALTTRPLLHKPILIKSFCRMTTNGGNALATYFRWWIWDDQILSPTAGTKHKRKELKFYIPYKILQKLHSCYWLIY